MVQGGKENFEATLLYVHARKAPRASRCLGTRILWQAPLKVTSAWGSGSQLQVKGLAATAMTYVFRFHTSKKAGRFQTSSLNSKPHASSYQEHVSGSKGLYCFE